MHLWPTGMCASPSWKRCVTIILVHGIWRNSFKCNARWVDCRRFRTNFVIGSICDAHTVTFTRCRMASSNAAICPGCWLRSAWHSSVANIRVLTMRETLRESLFICLTIGAYCAWVCWCVFVVNVDLSRWTSALFGVILPTRWLQVNRQLVDNNNNCDRVPVRRYYRTGKF